MPSKILTTITISLSGLEGLDPGPDPNLLAASFLGVFWSFLGGSNLFMSILSSGTHSSKRLLTKNKQRIEDPHITVLTIIRLLNTQKRQ